VYVKYIPLPDALINTYPVAITGHAAGSDASTPANIPDIYADAIIYKGLAEIASTMSESSDDIAKWEMKYFAVVNSIKRAKGRLRVRDAGEY
jgi:hypothetical protein